MAVHSQINHLSAPVLPHSTVGHADTQTLAVSKSLDETLVQESCDLRLTTGNDPPPILDPECKINVGPSCLGVIADALIIGG